MEETSKDNPKVENENKKQDCGCDDNCCLPKKNTILTKLIFVVIVLAALGIISIRLFHQSSTSTNQQLFKDPNAPVWCDTTATKTCDTTKGSSCCPKSK
jgi:hypothetical protein